MLSHYLGTIINIATVIIGSLLGVFLNNRIPKKINQTVMQGLALSTSLMGMKMGLETKNFLLIVISLVLGAIIGELLGIEDKFDQAGQWLEKRFSSDKEEGGSFTKGFVSTSLLFCVGPMAIIGCIENGLTGKYDILLTKAVMDGFASIAFASTLGIGVLFSALSIFFYQGGLTLLAGMVKDFLTEPVIREMTATGGVIIVGLGMNILGITKVKVGNLLPAILVVVILASFFSH